ncbi:MAG: phosphotransferase [Verrucomicrobiota bacterium]
MYSTQLAIQAATKTAVSYGITPDRCDILQNSSTLVVRLTDTLVARVVQDTDGPRQGTEWFARENLIAQHLTRHSAPVIPLHPGLPPGPHFHLGYPMNFWEFVTVTNTTPNPAEIGSVLYHCHRIMRTFEAPLPSLGILQESLTILQNRELFTRTTQQMLIAHLLTSLPALSATHHQSLHGDAHMGNLLNTTRGLLLTDWEDTFSGPVEWDLASLLWNAHILEDDQHTVHEILSAYETAGGSFSPKLLDACYIARGAVMTAWYPILYPNPNAERQSKLERRIEWLSAR